MVWLLVFVIEEFLSMNLFWVVEDEDEQQEAGQKVRVTMK